MKNKLENSLPQMLPGVVLVQCRQCGKSNCKCTSGRKEDMHIGHYRFWREGGVLKKQYVKKQDIERVKKACRRRQRWESQFRGERSSWRKLAVVNNVQIKELIKQIHQIHVE